VSLARVAVRSSARCRESPGSVIIPGRGGSGVQLAGPRARPTVTESRSRSSDHEHRSRSRVRATRPPGTVSPSSPRQVEVSGGFHGGSPAACQRLEAARPAAARLKCPALMTDGSLFSRGRAADYFRYPGGRGAASRHMIACSLRVYRTARVGPVQASPISLPSPARLSGCPGPRLTSPPGAESSSRAPGAFDGSVTLH